MRFPTYLFRRVTSSGQFMPELDGLRAVAILPVVLFHATLSMFLKGAPDQVSSFGGDVFRAPLGWVVSHGFLGVQLFFVISGFVVTLPFARHWLLSGHGVPLKPGFMRAFYLKRLTRIEPPYVIALVLFGLGVLAVAPENFRFADFAYGLVYLRTAIFGNEPWAFFISWSLEIEVQFYLLAPFIASVFRIRDRIVRRAVLMTAIAIASAYTVYARLGGIEPPPLIGPLQHGLWLGTEIAFFLVGMLVADLWVTQECRSGIRVRSFMYDLAWVLGIIAIVVSYRLIELTPFGITALIGGLFVVTLGAFRGRAVRALLSNPLLTAIGGACYTIYLLHFLLISLFGRFIAPYTTSAFEWNVLVIALPFSIVVVFMCLACFPILERPFMFGDWPHVVWRAFRERNPRILAELLRAAPISRPDRGSPGIAAVAK